MSLYLLTTHRGWRWPQHAVSCPSPDSPWVAISSPLMLSPRKPHIPPGDHHVRHHHQYVHHRQFSTYIIVDVDGGLRVERVPVGRRCAAPYPQGAAGGDHHMSWRWTPQSADTAVVGHVRTEGQREGGGGAEGTRGVHSFDCGTYIRTHRAFGIQEHSLQRKMGCFCINSVRAF